MTSPEFIEAVLPLLFWGAMTVLFGIIAAHALGVRRRTDDDDTPTLYT